MLLKTCSLVVIAVLAVSPVVRAEEPVHQWSQRFSDGDNQTAAGVAADASGSVIMRRSFQGTVDFGSDALKSAGSNDIFVVKFLSSWTDATSGPLGDTGFGAGVAWGDYDNDGDLDLYLTNYGQANKLFRNDGGGVFTDVTSGPLGDTGFSTGVAWGDYDNDGNLDLYIANQDQANKLFRNEGGGLFTDVTSGPLGDTGPSNGVAWGDYDYDGDLDLYLANEGQANKLLRNEWGMGFIDVTSDPLGDPALGAGVAWGDYDNDGDIDLYLVNWGQANKLFRNAGGGVFTDVTSGPLGDTGYGLGAAWGDYDNDGDLDLYVTNDGEANKLFRNDGGGVFTDVTSGPLGDAGYSRGLAWGDYDNDGDLDLYLANGSEPNKLFRNDGGGVFTDVTSGPLGDTGFGSGLAWGDYDDDGDLDLYLANDGPNKLFRNDLTSGFHWLHVDLEGVISNRSGIGARVRVVAGGTSQIREVSGGSGFISQNSLTAEFGLGTTAVVDTVEVRWPSGITDDSLNVAVDQRIIVLEGSTGPGQLVCHDGVWDLGEFCGYDAYQATGVGEMNHDCFVNLMDLQLFAKDFLQSGPAVSGDLNGDGVCNITDFVNFAEHWADSVPVCTRSGMLPDTFEGSIALSFSSDSTTIVFSDTLGIGVAIVYVVIDGYGELGSVEYTVETSPNLLILGHERSYASAFSGYDWTEYDPDAHHSYKATVATSPVPEGPINIGYVVLYHTDDASGWIHLVDFQWPFFHDCYLRWNNVEANRTYYFATVSHAEIETPVGIESEDLPTPLDFSLHQNHPNPFNPVTTISFSLAERVAANLSIFSLEGQLIRTLVSETLDEGFNEITWDGRDALGNQVSSGVYFYRLTAGGKTLTKKMVLLK